MSAQIRKNSNRGFVLITVLWVLAVLTVVTLAFGRRALLDERAAAYAIDELQATWLARGAAIQGVVEFEQTQTLRQLLDGLRQNQNQPVSGISTNESVLLGKVHDLRNVFPNAFSGPFEAERCGYVVQDEESRFSLNNATAELLENIPGLDTKIRSAIIERIRESQTSESKPFSVIEEMFCIEGVNRKLFSDTSLGKIFTVYGDGKININSASREVLMLIPGIDESLVTQVLAVRAGPDGELNTADDVFFDSLDDLITLGKLPPDKISPITSFCKTHSRYFKISGFATRRQQSIYAESSIACVRRDDGIGVLRWEENTGAP